MVEPRHLPRLAVSPDGLHLLPARGCSSDGRALHSQCRGQGFDPPQLHGPHQSTGAGIVFACIWRSPVIRDPEALRSHRRAPAVLRSGRIIRTGSEGRAGATVLPPDEVTGSGSPRWSRAVLRARHDRRPADGARGSHHPHRDADRIAARSGRRPAQRALLRAAPQGSWLLEQCRATRDLFGADDQLLKHAHRLTDWTRHAGCGAVRHSSIRCRAAGASRRRGTLLMLGVKAAGSARALMKTRCERGARSSPRCSACRRRPRRRSARSTNTGTAAGCRTASRGSAAPLLGPDRRAWRRRWKCSRVPSTCGRPTRWRTPAAVAGSIRCWSIALHAFQFDAVLGIAA